jgi:hypothetical protein
MSLEELRSILRIILINHPVLRTPLLGKEIYKISQGFKILTFKVDG